MTFPQITINAKWNVWRKFHTFTFSYPKPYARPSEEYFEWRKANPYYTPAYNDINRAIHLRVIVGTVRFWITIEKEVYDH